MNPRVMFLNLPNDILDRVYVSSRLMTESSDTKSFLDFVKSGGAFKLESNLTPSMIDFMARNLQCDYKIYLRLSKDGWISDKIAVHAPAEAIRPLYKKKIIKPLEISSADHGRFDKIIIAEQYRYGECISFYVRYTDQQTERN